MTAYFIHSAIAMGFPKHTGVDRGLRRVACRSNRGEQKAIEGLEEQSKAAPAL